MATTGRLPPASPMLLLLMVMLSLPVAAVEPAIRMVAAAGEEAAPFWAAVPVEDPRMVQFVTVLVEASLMKRRVLVPAVAETVVFEIVNESVPLFRPLIVTLSAPFRSTSGEPAVVAPVTVRAPTGLIVNVVHEPPAG